MVYSKRAHFLKSYHRYQEWSLPDSIIYYITKYPSSAKGYQKIVQSCKYFFIKNSIIIVESLCCFNSNTWIAFFNNKEKLINFENLMCKFWIMLEFSSYTSKAPLNSVSSIISKIYRCDATFLRLSDQILSFKHFGILSSNVSNINLSRSIIKNEDDSIVSLAKIVKVLPKIKKFILFDHPTVSIIAKDTVNGLLELPHFSKINYFRLYDIPELFDIQKLFNHLKKNNNQSDIVIFYTVVSQAYKNLLEKIINEMLAIENQSNYSLYIQWSGIGI